MHHASLKMLRGQDTKKYETGTSCVCQPNVIQTSRNVRTLVYLNPSWKKQKARYIELLGIISGIKAP